MDDMKELKFLKERINDYDATSFMNELFLPQKTRHIRGEN